MKPYMKVLIAGIVGVPLLIGPSYLMARGLRADSERKRHERGINKEIAEFRRKIQQKKNKINSKPFFGTVLAEHYENRLVSVPGYHQEKHIDGLVSQAHAIAYSNETVRLESKYTLEVKLDDGKVIGLSIIDDGPKTKESLDILIEKGTQISFNNLIHEDENYFGKDTRIGTRRAGSVKVY